MSAVPFVRVHTRLAVALFALASSGCRDATSSGAVLTPIVPSSFGANGCRGPNQVFTAPQAATAIVLATYASDPSSQISAVAGGEALVATGAGATVFTIDFTTGVPVETEIVGGTTVQDLIAGAGVAGAPELSGIAVSSTDRLLVVERTSNTILSIERSAPFTVAFFAGRPDASPGFSDTIVRGSVILPRFHFSAPTQLCPTGDAAQRVFVADPGNHAIRMIDALGVVSTIAGAGAAYFADGDLSDAAFDTPTGLSIACNGVLIVAEEGGSGAGHRLRSLSIGSVSPFGGFFGSAGTLVGSGVDASVEGDGAGAHVARPQSPIVTSAGEIYWIDSDTGVLRRYRVDGSVDCPLASDCASAVATPDFPPGHAFSLTETDGGVLYVLDATAGVLYRVTP